MSGNCQNAAGRAFPEGPIRTLATEGHRQGKKDAPRRQNRRGGIPNRSGGESGMSRIQLHGADGTEAGHSSPSILNPHRQGSVFPEKLNPVPGVESGLNVGHSGFLDDVGGENQPELPPLVPEPDLIPFWIQLRCASPHFGPGPALPHLWANPLQDFEGPLDHLSRHSCPDLSVVVGMGWGPHRRDPRPAQACSWIFRPSKLTRSRGGNKALSPRSSECGGWDSRIPPPAWKRTPVKVQAPTGTGAPAR